MTDKRYFHRFFPQVGPKKLKQTYFIIEVSLCWSLRGKPVAVGFIIWRLAESGAEYRSERQFGTPFRRDNEEVAAPRLDLRHHVLAVPEKALD